MKKIRKIYIPSICITFTMAILWSCIWNVLKGNWLEGFALFVFQILGYLVITHDLLIMYLHHTVHGYIIRQIYQTVSGIGMSVSFKLE